MRFDTKKRRYVDDDGNVLSPADVRKEVHDYIEGEKEKVQQKARSLLNGTITLAAFFMFMRLRVETWNEIAGSIAYGGKAQLDREQRARIKADIDSELQYLRDFRAQAQESFRAASVIAAQVASDINASSQVEREIRNALVDASPSTAEQVARQAVGSEMAPLVKIDQALASSLIGGTIAARASMYADAAYSTYQNNEAARESDAGITGARRICPEDDASCDECVDAASTFFSAIEDLPEIGSLQCLNNCRCYFEYAERTSVVVGQGDVESAAMVQ